MLRRSFRDYQRGPSRLDSQQMNFHYSSTRKKPRKEKQQRRRSSGNAWPGLWGTQRPWQSLIVWLTNLVTFVGLTTFFEARDRDRYQKSRSTPWRTMGRAT